MRVTTGWQGLNGSLAMERVTIERRDLRADDIAVQVDFCGVCHSDLHALRRAQRAAVVPGHEFIGTVTAVGPSVGRFDVGDKVAVGTIVDSCGECAMCRRGEEVHCLAGRTATYGSVDRHDGRLTQGAFSREYVLSADFAYPLPDGLDPAAAAPLMCAGITVWTPLREAGVGPGSRVAVAGLGGLGHLAVKFAAALGAEVTVLSRTADKAADAAALGAVDLLVTADAEQMLRSQGRFDLILDTISETHDLSPLWGLLGFEGTLTMLGVFWELPVDIMDLMLGRKRLAASVTGGRDGTAQMLRFASEHSIVAEIEVLPSARVAEALSRLEEGDVRYRFVLDLADLDRVDRLTSAVESPAGQDLDAPDGAD